MYWTLGNWKLNFVLYSARERHDPPAHSIYCTYTQTEKERETANRKHTKASFNSQEDLEQSSRISSPPLNQHNLWQLKSTLEILLCNAADQWAHLRGLVALGLLLYELSFGVNRKDSAEWHSNLLVGKDVLEETVRRSGFKRRLRTTSAVFSTQSTNKNIMLC